MARRAGIVGSERGGVLTNQLRDTPCSVVLLDEIEKASPNVLNLFLQAFDEGWLTDGRGRRVYLSDAIVIMTSNVGSEHFRKLTNPLGFGSATPTGQITTDIDRELERKFPPEFRNRIDAIVVFEPLTKEEVREIALKYLGTGRGDAGAPRQDAHRRPARRSIRSWIRAIARRTARAFSSESSTTWSSYRSASAGRTWSTSAQR